jgi:hypothetical protein
MNAARRKKIDDAIALIEQAKQLLEAVRDEEQEAFDNMPEALQSGDKGSQSQVAIDAIEEAFESLDGAIANCETAKE